MTAVNAAAIERARLRLDADLAMADHRGEPVSCRGPRKDYWTSENRAERVYAALLCRTCPALAACSQYADALAPKHGVWAGRDRTPRPKKEVA